MASFAVGSFGDLSLNRVYEDVISAIESFLKKIQNGG
jgi:hypothetical protein